MIIYELKCKRMITNLDDKRVEDKVVGKNEEEWSIPKVAELILTKRAKFFYLGKEVTAATLDMLPECPLK